MLKKIPISCSYCKNVFYDYAYQKRKYCSQKCCNAQKGKPPKKYICLYCNKSFMDYVSDHRKYCSHKCCYMHRRILKQGKNSHFWQGGKTTKHKILRTSAAYYEWRKQVFERDNYTCQECHKNKTYLHAHHIKPFASYPNLRFNIKNGITLCHKCHSKKHKHKITKKIA